MTSGVLLIHGLTSSPTECAYLATVLKEHGVQVSVPLLPGHGGTVADLAHASDERAWSATVTASLQALLAQHPESKVSVVGSSMGALLALQLAQRYPDRVDKLVLLGPPLQLRRPWMEFAVTALSAAVPPCVARAFGGLLPIIPKRHGSPNRFTRPYEALPAYPVASVLALGRLRRQVLRAGLVTSVSTLVMYDSQDHMLGPVGFRPWHEMAAKTGCAEFLTVEEWRGGGHELLVGLRAVEVTERVIRFLGVT